MTSPLVRRRWGRFAASILVALTGLRSSAGVGAEEGLAVRIPEQRGRIEWIHDMQLLVGLGFGFAPTEMKIDRWVADLDFDLVDWCQTKDFHLTDPLRSRYGVGTTGADHQWSEFWEFQYPLLHGADPQQFLSEVLCNRIDGSRAIDEYQGSTRPLTRFSVCANRPRWREFITARDVELLPHYSAVNVDVMRSWNRAQAFCADCQQVFRDWLRTHFEPDRLRSLGVDDVATFDFLAYVHSHHPGKPTREWLDDPLVREYLRAQTVVQLGHLREFSQTIHAAADKLDRGMPVFGNTGHIVWDAANDLIELEIDPNVFYYGYPDSRRACFRIKQGLASGRYQQPVWIRGFPSVTWPRADFERSYQDLIYGEAFANGAVRVFDLTHEDAPANPVFEQREYFYRRFIDYAHLIHAHRAALQDRENAAEIGLVYSLPTEWYESGGPFRFGDSPHQLRLQGWAKALDEAHLPYEVVIFGHPEFRPDWEDLLARLQRYRAIVVPAATCLTDAQIEILRRYLSAGGNLIWSGQLGRYDENRAPRAAKPFSDLSTETWERPFPGAGRAAALADIDLDYGSAVAARRAPDAEQFYSMKSAVLWAINGARQIMHTDASPETQFNLWLARNHRSASLHLVNYGIDLQRDDSHPQHDVRIEVRLPAALEKFDRATLVIPGEPDRDLAFTGESDLVRLAVPKLNVWAFIVFSSGREQESATALTETRAALRRLSILQQDLAPWMPRYRAAETLYEERRYDDACAATAKLLADIRSAVPLPRR